jgi:glucose-6-phosphate 1-dehydrogenase
MLVEWGGRPSADTIRATSDAEGRAEYYDHAGALKDVLQSHMLRLLALVCMKPLADDTELHACKLEIVLELDDARWSGTRFVLRAGKALARRRKLVLLRFRGGGSFRIGIDGPEDLSLRLAGRADSPLELRAPPLRKRLPAYAHVLLDLLQGSSALSVGAREAEQAWQVVAPVLAAWESGDVILEEYAAGSAGPS